MRTYITYFLTALFLLFVVESKLNVKTLRNDYTSHTSHKMPKRVNRLNQTYDKLTMQQSPNDVGNSYSLELTEDDFQFSDTLQTVIAFASIFTLVYIFGLKSYKNIKSAILGFVPNFSAIKTFILIRSIRI